MNATLTLLQKEIALFLRDKTALLLTFLVPFAIIAIVGNIFSEQADGGGMQGAIKLAVLDLSGTEASQSLVEALGTDAGIELIGAPVADSEGGSDSSFDLASLRADIEERQYNFALVIPPDFMKESGIGLRLNLLSNPRNEVEAQIIRGLIQRAIFGALPRALGSQLDALQGEILGEERYEAFLDGMASLVSLYYDEFEYETVRQNMGAEGLAQFLESPANADADTEGDSGSGNAFFGDLLEIEEDQVYGKEIRNPYLTRIIGGYAIMFLLFATTGSASSLFEERNEGIFQRLLSLPVRRGHILWSKYLFNTLLGVVQVQTLFIASSLLFDVGIFGGYFRLLLVSLFAASACAAFGMLLASLAKTQQQAQGMGTLLIISMSALGGAWFPLAWMPDLMQVIGKLTLVYWGVEGFMNVLWEDASLARMLPTLATLFAYSATLLGIGLWRFRAGDLFR